MYEEFIRKHLPKKYDYLWEYVGTKWLALDDLLFLIPNNVKKRNHIPMTRVTAKRKSKYKKERKSSIFHASLYKIIEEMIDNVLPKEWQDNSFYGKFVDIKTL